MNLPRRIMRLWALVLKNKGLKIGQPFLHNGKVFLFNSYVGKNKDGIRYIKAWAPNKKKKFYYCREDEIA